MNPLRDIATRARNRHRARLRRRFPLRSPELLERRELLATIDIAPLGSFATGSYATGAAEISAYDAATQRVFFTNASDNLLGVIDVSDPAAPVGVAGIPPIDLSPYGAGPNSVAVAHGVVAVAVEASPKTDPGRVVFFDTDGVLLGQIVVGALPDMLTFTPNGLRLLVANEGEPNSYGQPDSVDPEGSVSIIDLSHGVAGATVQTATFTAFNGQEASLRTAGVRIFGPNATAAQDFEPEYIAVSPDGTTAFVTLQENNALATINIASAVVTDVSPLGFKDHNQNFTLRTSEFAALPSIGSTAAGQPLTLGGFSGLTFAGVDATTGRWKFLTHTDRGPNGEPDANGRRPFLLPDFAPRIVQFEYDPNDGQITLTGQITLKRDENSPLTGLPNLTVGGGTANSPHNDEIPVDLQDNILGLDPLGGDFEGLTINPIDGAFWMADEYRPALYQFSPDGVLLERYVPSGSAAAAGLAPGALGVEALPSVLGQRRQNRGFEGITFHDGKLYAIVQSPLRNPPSASNGALNALQNVRLLEFDPTTMATRQFLYVMDNANLGTPGNTRPDKIGDLASFGGGNFLIVERDDDSVRSDVASNIEKKIYRFNLAGATDVNGLDAPIDVGGGTMKTVDQMSAAELAAVGVTPIGKTLHVDLNAVGYNGVEKVEGLAVIDANTLAVVNDNDFGVANIVIDTVTGTFTLGAGYTPEPEVLGIITAGSQRLDASDRDTPGSSNAGLINIRNWPVLGMYQPDAIAAYEVNGETYLVTANEGDARDYTGFQEESRVGSLTLDAAAFAAKGFSDVSTGATGLRHNDNLGRLNVTKTLGNTDGDAEFEALYSFGGRSFSIWTSDGQRVFDSGDDFEQITAAAFPANFNASNDNNNLDDRSDNKGPEPEAVTIGRIGDRTYAFIGLERIGGVMIYDVTDPHSPVFESYLNNRVFTSPFDFATSKDLGVEDVKFIPADASPTGGPMLMTANELSGTVSFFSLNVAPKMTSFVGGAMTAPARINSPVTVTGSFTDVGAGTHTVSVDWGDGVVTNGTVNEVARTFTATHPYATSGRFVVLATLSDGQFSDAATSQSLISGTSVSGDTLLVIATNGADNMLIRSLNAATIQVRNFVPGQSANVSRAGLTTIELVLAGGHDRLTIERGVNLDVTVDAGDGNDLLNNLGTGRLLFLGGDGNDIVMAGNGASVLVGGAGRDTLIGGGGRNVMIGGADADVLLGLGNEDLLIGGTTIFDEDRAALLAIRDRWSAPDSFASRGAAFGAGIPSPVGPLRLRRGKTVLDDAAIDLVLGGAQQDWVFGFGGDLGGN